MKPANVHKGEVYLTIGERTHVLCFNYEALERLRVRFGPTFDDALDEAFDNTDLKAVCDALEIGLVDGPLADEIYEASPPVNAAHFALIQSLVLAHNGPDGLKEVEGQGPLANKMTSRLIRLLGQWFLPRRRGSRRRSSGNSRLGSSAGSSKATTSAAG